MGYLKQLSQEQQGKIRRDLIRTDRDSKIEDLLKAIDNVIAFVLFNISRGKWV